MSGQGLINWSDELCNIAVCVRKCVSMAIWMQVSGPNVGMMADGIDLWEGKLQ